MPDLVKQNGNMVQHNCFTRWVNCLKKPCILQQIVGFVSISERILRDTSVRFNILYFKCKWAENLNIGYPLYIP